MWVWSTLGSKNAHFSQFFALNFAFFQGKNWFSAQTFAFATPTTTKSVGQSWWQLFEKFLIINLPWWYHGEGTRKGKTREFSQTLPFFDGFRTSQVVFSNSTRPILPFFGWKMLFLAPSDFKGRAVWASQEDAFVKGNETKQFSFFLHFGKFWIWNSTISQLSDCPSDWAKWLHRGLRTQKP